MNKNTKIWSYVFKVGLVLAGFAIIAKLFFIQVIQHNYYQGIADAKHIKPLKIQAKRGEIFVRDGEKFVPVVMNTERYLVFVDPMLVKDSSRIEAELRAGYTDKLLISEFEPVFRDPTRRYVEVARGLTFAEATELKGLKISGLGFKKLTERVYTEGAMAGQVMGFVNIDGVGQYGVEGMFNKKLSGTDGVLKTVTDVRNIPLSVGKDNVREPAIDGEDVYLTIDRNIQRATERALMEEIMKAGAKFGSAIVMDPETSEVLAVANYPSYSPDEYYRASDIKVFQNSAFEEGYESASVLKTLVYAAGLDTGRLNMSSTYHNAGFETIDGFKIKNSNSTYKIGQVDMMFAFKNSFNTGSIHVLRGLDGNYDNLTLKDKEVMYEYYHDRFKLGVKTGVGVNEASGLVYGPSSVEGTAARYANMTFGQGLLTTPIQLATAYSAVVNGGIYRGATILAEMDGAGNYVNKNVQGERAIKETTSAELRNMLVETWKNYNSRNPLRNKKGVTIGAKTGTGQVASASGGYQGANEQIASVAGFVGEELPEYVIIVKIGGGGNFWGSEQAMPVFNRIVEYLINYQNIGV